MRHQKPPQTEDEVLKIRTFTLGDSHLNDLAIRDSGIREATGCSVVTIKRADGEIIINPHSNEIMKTGDTLIMMGSLPQLDVFNNYIFDKNLAI
jgi:CPA2 family monovalent cation:H+ antiporter-2